MEIKLAPLLESKQINWEQILKTILLHFNYTTGTIHTLDSESNLLKILSHHGIPPQILPIIGSIPIGKGIAGAAAETRQPVELCNLQEDLGGVAKPNARQTQVQGSIAVPLENNGSLLGTLGIAKTTPHIFSEA